MKTKAEIPEDLKQFEVWIDHGGNLQVIVPKSVPDLEAIIAKYPIVFDSDSRWAKEHPTDYTNTEPHFRVWPEAF